MQTRNNLRQIVHTHLSLSPSSTNWYRCKSQGVNRHTTQCTSPVSVVSHYKLASGWGLWKRRSSLLYRPMWLQEGLHAFLHMTHWPCAIAVSICHCPFVTSWCLDVLSKCWTVNILVSSCNQCLGSEFLWRQGYWQFLTSNLPYLRNGAWVNQITPNFKFWVVLPIFGVD